MLHDGTVSLQNKAVDRFGQEKLYIQLTRIMLEEITSGRWGLGKRIPTEDDLCNKFTISKITVRQAINNLVADGYLMKYQGKGTFVSSVMPVIGLAMKTKFTEDMFGKEVEAEKELISRGIVEPRPDIRAYLKTDDTIYHFLCRRRVSGEPAYIDDSYIPYNMVPEIEHIDITRTSFYTLLQEKAAKKIFKLIQTIEVLMAESDFAEYLELSAGAPALAVHRLLISSDETPVGYTRFIGRSDRYKFQTEFERIR
jgi:GntR family transcriptional regulator